MPQFKTKSKNRQAKNKGAFLPPPLSFYWKTKNRVQISGAWEGRIFEFCYKDNKTRQKKLLFIYLF